MSAEEQKQAEIEAAWEVYVKANATPKVGYTDWREKHLSTQKMLCAYCTIKLTEIKIQGAEDRQATLDHVIPLSEGGPDEFENTVAACAYCNCQKASLSAEEFRSSYAFLYRIKEARLGPNQCSNEPKRPYYDGDALERGIGIKFKGKERTDVCEYSVSEGWIKIQAGRSVNRRGDPLLLKLKGLVEAYYLDTSAYLKNLF